MTKTAPYWTDTEAISEGEEILQQNKELNEGKTAVAAKEEFTNCIMSHYKRAISCPKVQIENVFTKSGGVFEMEDCRNLVSIQILTDCFEPSVFH